MLKYKPLTAIVLLVLCTMGASVFAGNGNDPEDPAEEQAVLTAIDSQVKALMEGLTLEDKIGEMTQLTLDMVCVGEPYNIPQPAVIDQAKLKKVLLEYRVGSILNNGGQEQTVANWHTIIEEIQKTAVQKESGIPVLYGIDAIHGTNYTKGATLFPQQIAIGATWNPEVAETAGRITAYETRASGIPWNFSPVQDLGRDPRWPRYWETFGEDVMLTSDLGAAMVTGYQGTNAGSNMRVAACLKHFLGYSQSLSGKDRTPAWIPERQLREYFLPPFKAAMDAGALTVMINSGEMNGIPVHANPAILTDLLRNELGFRGVAVSDWEDIKYLYTRHKVAVDYKDAIRMAINAGVDMSMVPTDLDFPVLLKELVEEGKVPMSRIDESVERILRLKIELGLFESPGPAFATYPEFASEAHAKASYEAACEAITLLKNENEVLPISSSARVLVTGPTANSLNCLNGGWSHTWQGDLPELNTEGKANIYQAIASKMGTTNVMYSEGSGFDETKDLQDAITKAGMADVIVLCLGESTYTEKPGDLDDINLPQAQVALAKAMAATGKPIVLVLAEGRPRIVREVEPLVDAAVMAYLPGDEGGRAVAAVLSGEVNPSGKLPFTYPRYSNDLLTYDHKNTEEFDADFSWTAFQPQWHFGHGLSYTTYEYSDLEISNKEPLSKDVINISVNVKNTGSRAGMEVVQLYIRDDVATVTPPVKRLRGYKKIALAPGETREISFEIKPEDLAFVGATNEWIVEPGTFTVEISGLKDQFDLQSGINKLKH